MLRGEHLESCHNSWTLVLNALKKAPDPDVIQRLHFRQLQGFRPLAEDVAHYKRATFLDDPWGTLA